MLARRLYLIQRLIYLIHPWTGYRHRRRRRRHRRQALHNRVEDIVLPTLNNLASIQPVIARRYGAPTVHECLRGLHSYLRLLQVLISHHLLQLLHRVARNPAVGPGSSESLIANGAWDTRAGATVSGAVAHPLTPTAKVSMPAPFPPVLRVKGSEWIPSLREMLASFLHASQLQQYVPWNLANQLQSTTSHHGSTITERIKHSALFTKVRPPRGTQVHRRLFIHLGTLRPVTV